MNPDLLLLNPQTEALEMALEGRFSVHRWHEIQDRAGLAAIGPRVRAVVAGGHVGSLETRGRCNRERTSRGWLRSW